MAAYSMSEAIKEATSDDLVAPAQTSERAARTPDFGYTQLEPLPGAFQDREHSAW